MVNKITLTLFLIISNNIFTGYADTTTCTGIHIQNSSTSTCTYITTTTSCNPKGYINYLQIYYCNFSSFPQAGFILLLIWLVILFYILSNTASDYFCPAVEHLSNSLNLSPAIAGTTLLPLGNGCTDVFSTVIAFTTTADGGDIGLNSVLGGSIFVTTVVVGVMSLLITYQKKVVVVDKPNFIRDVVFLLVTLTNVLVIVIIGEIGLWLAIVFVLTYVVYILLVCYIHFIHQKKQKQKQKLVFGSVNDGIGDDHVIRVPLLCSVEEENVVHPVEKVVHCEEQVVDRRSVVTIVNLLLYVVKLPVYLPRRVTIPVVTKERWSKPFLVISMVLGPLMVGVVWNTKEGSLGLKGSLVTYFVVGAIGIGLGTCTYAFTSSTMPPQRCLVFWYASGFLMSVTWTYVTCNELVSLLESLGNIIGMNPAIIGLTVLAWGNSIGDLAANVALAMYGGPDGPQIAMSGCYAGPLFNVLIGLGFSFVFVSWSKYPAAYVIPEDPNLCETIGFLMVGLLWALVILTKREMRLDHTLGGGLLVIYLCFLFIKLARAIGLLG
ncbi:putative sodium/calcium exchanger membrane region [Helianthus annuus]|uniref:Putative calcium exchanger 7 n=1 Tax=Helianthus annuus TaxID=4232 RepID=A0A251SRD3_HELAN|nr:cation/calcium exchanger 1 [Helianthus annuus]KAF5772976.1 putative sodium/calcium exchanger membrane region [Helianthus annuus]KAJ0476526.1 putative sodium/calcium exchanger membrane region [Helianthus annuus]KAJ0497353.1 putative sodium/calcium exchanger membrane region [Helianthus annuus]KAJ0663367.1 putative sodium/calcium exchanger membrane region [Helianthus annuus]